MKHKQLIDELLELNEYERLGQSWFLKNGKNMDYRHIMPSYATYNNDFLQSKDFFSEGKELEIEKTLRYVDIPEHSHEFLEFVYVLKGNCTQYVSHHIYTHDEGDFIVIPPRVSHTIQVPENSLCFTMKIQKDSFVSLRVPNTALFVLPLLFPCKDDPLVLNSILTIYSQQENAQAYHEEIIIHLFSALITYLMQTYYDSMCPLNMENINNYKTLQIVNFIFENYRNITLRGLAAEFHYNESYLSSLIHKGTGKTFSQNLREFRMVRAEEILRTTPKIKLADVCEKIGYNDTVKFIRDFKLQYGVTPAKYKQRFQIK